MEMDLDLMGLDGETLALVPPTEEECVERLLAWRWADAGFTCRRCSGDRGYRVRARPRVVCCAYCGAHNSVTAGTLLHRSRVDLRCWFLGAALLMRPQGCSATEFANRTGMHRQSAWRILHRLRAAAEGGAAFLLRGNVELACFGVRSKQPRRRPSELVTTMLDDRGGVVHLAAGRGWERRRAVWKHAPHLRRPPRAQTDLNAPVRRSLMAVRAQLRRTHRWVSALWLPRYLATASYRANHRQAGHADGLVALALRRPRARFEQVVPNVTGPPSRRRWTAPSR